MESASPHVAALTPDAIRKIQSLEAQLGSAYLVAYRDWDAFEQKLPPAPLGPDQVSQVTRAEQELGVCLMAYSRAA